MGVKEYQFAGDEIQKHLNKVFKPAVVEFEILHADFKMSELTSFSHGGSPWNSVYNDDQKRVLRAYNDSIKDGLYYLFFIDNVTDKKDGNGTMVSGYMPRGYNCGFIYDGGSPHTIAHELGHGIAGLEHVFENSKSSGKTQNLMDYASGEELWHFQWDAIQDPSRVWMKWNKDESEGEKIETDYYISEDKEGLVFSSKVPIDVCPGYYDTYYKFKNQTFASVYDSVFRNIECVKNVLDIFRDKNNKNALILEDHWAKPVGAYGETRIYIRGRDNNFQPNMKSKSVQSKKYVYIISGDRVYPKKSQTMERLDTAYFKSNPSNFTLAVKITLYTQQIIDDFGSEINMNNHNEKYKVSSSEYTSIIKAQMLLTLGHEMFIHYHNTDAVLSWTKKNFSVGLKCLYYDSGVRGDNDHKKYIHGGCPKMTTYITQLKKYIVDHPELGIKKESLDIIIRAHNNKYKN